MGQLIMPNYQAIKDKPKIFKVKTCLTKDSQINSPASFIKAVIDDSFALFTSKMNQLLLIYSNSNEYITYSLICYDLKNKCNIVKIAKAHNDRIYTIIHFFDKNIKEDLVLTSSFDKKIKIWNLHDCSLVFTKIPEYNFKYSTHLLSSNIIYYDKKYYTLVSAFDLYSNGLDLLYYDYDGKKNALENSADKTNHLTVYYNKDIPYILAGNFKNIKIFDFAKKKLIKTYKDQDKNINYNTVIIYENEKELKDLICSCSDGYIRIWDYNSNVLKHAIFSLFEGWIFGLCLIDKKYLLAGCGDSTIKEFDLETNQLILTLNRNKNSYYELFAIKLYEINSKRYLISHSDDGMIEIWEEEI